jgi:1-acyl-sn-glycerol-3-phosphate acyltransferase
VTPAADRELPSDLSPPAPATVSPFWRWVTYLVLMPAIGIATAFFGCISLICGLWDSSGEQQHAVARIWASTLLVIAFSPVEVIGLEKVPRGVSAVFASNHLSYFDTPVLFSRLPFQFRILAKQSLWKIPFVGWYLNRSGQVPIDAKSGRSAIAGLLRGAKTLESGMPLLIFPEGGRSPDGRMAPLQSGAAFMALRAQVPVVPIALLGTFELLPMHTYHLSPRPVKMIIGDPIQTTGRTTREADALTDEIFSAITRLCFEGASTGQPRPSRKPQP